MIHLKIETIETTLDLINAISNVTKTSTDLSVQREYVNFKRTYISTIETLSNLLSNFPKNTGIYTINVSEDYFNKLMSLIKDLKLLVSLFNNLEAKC